ncbi:MAG: hypothetical protein HZA81_01210 [Candidatus Taylorbacteria bacterium]|nr:hypothetical protein [Candidatus Taylorbacteria bacterium]
MTSSKAAIVATVGPVSSEFETLFSMAKAGMDVARLNYAWGSREEKEEFIKAIRRAGDALGRRIPILGDLPGPRIQGEGGHTYDPAGSVITPEDRAFIHFSVKQGIEYLGVSFVGSARDIEDCRKIVREAKGKQRIVAKIERVEALVHLDSIIEAADAIMVARGDLGNEVPLERIPFVQADIVSRANRAGKPVIVATEMLLSMVESARPSRAEVTDVANAILQGADAIMLSDETARGKHPVEAVKAMERIAYEAERHLSGKRRFLKL